MLISPQKQQKQWINNYVQMKIALGERHSAIKKLPKRRRAQKQDGCVDNHSRQFTYITPSPSPAHLCSKGAPWHDPLL